MLLLLIFDGNGFLAQFTKKVPIQCRSFFFNIYSGHFLLVWPGLLHFEHFLTALEPLAGSWKIQLASFTTTELGSEGFWSPGRISVKNLFHLLFRQIKEQLLYIFSIHYTKQNCNIFRFNILCWPMYIIIKSYLQSYKFINIVTIAK